MSDRTKHASRVAFALAVSRQAVIAAHKTVWYERARDGWWPRVASEGGLDKCSLGAFRAWNAANTGFMLATLEHDELTLWFSDLFSHLKKDGIIPSSCKESELERYA